MSTAIVPANDNHAIESRHALLPAMSIAEAIERFNDMFEFTQKIMKKGKDFGEIPGTDKPTLLKPGAEKLSTFFGMAPRFKIVDTVRDWTGAEHGGEAFFFYEVKCRLFRDERFMGEGDGSCNSWESKYRYRWVIEHDVPTSLDRSKLKRRGGKISEFAFAVDKAETGGKYGKPAEHWQRFKDAIESGQAKKIRKKKRDNTETDGWEIDATLFRIPNTDIADVVNTVLKMAAKRALVAAVLVTTNASEYYSQDLEDLEIIDTEYAVSAHQPKASPVPKSDSAPTNGHGHKGEMKPRTGVELEPLVREVAAKWERAGYCQASAVFLRLGDWAHGQGCDKPMKEWPERLVGATGDYLRQLHAKLIEPAPQSMLDTIDELCDELQWDEAYRQERLALANLIQTGEVPNEHKAQAIILFLQQALREDEATDEATEETTNATEKDEIPF